MGLLQVYINSDIPFLRLYRDEMQRLLSDLERNGLMALPWMEQDYDADIGPERAFYLYREGKRTRVRKDDLLGSDLSTFTRVEKRVVVLTLAR